ncbi:MAG: DUF3106 domain-containing protein [Deltaproteobacteria bacterium]|nr:DUF3106 domain-containing protein [Deltaproteobacteria bacterium]MBW2319273.1 DUF3106 domain-containing protein [Deltaproteobacteria bacterium]
MIRQKNRWLLSLKAWGILTLMLWVSISSPASIWGGVHHFCVAGEAQPLSPSFREMVTNDWEVTHCRDERGTVKHMGSHKEFFVRAKKYPRNYQSLPPEEKTRLKRRFREWQSLPQERKRTLRHRMEKWQQLPPERREHFQQWFQQWKELSPEERGVIRKKLEKWDRLPPDEQEKVRRRFYRP